MFFCISGLPRSGSTLLCNILAQNPAFYVSTATSGCHDVLFGIRNQYDKLIEHQAERAGPDRLKRILNGALRAYHGTDKEVIFDKGRGWLSMIEMLIFMGIEPKILVPVRDLSEILASFEILWRKSTGQSQWSIEQASYFDTQTVAGRCEMWSNKAQVVGLAYNRLKDAILRGHRSRLFLVEMTDLTVAPAAMMKNIYAFLGLPAFEHNFDNVEQVTKEDDEYVHRIPNLHTIRNKVEPVSPRAATVLGPDVFKLYQNQEFWRS